MQYTTQGLMTPADLADRAELHDEHRHPHCPGHPSFEGEILFCPAVDDCPGESTGSGGGPRQAMGTYERLTMYQARSASGRITPAQRRRLVKKAGRDPQYTVTRDNGMGFADPARQGMRELEAVMPIPVSGQPY